MGAPLKKKGERGNAANYITRTKAVRKLQLTLAEFRRLCILKGIYPREPKNKKKASGNRNSNNTFYFTKDIKFLLHEPIVQKFREHRAFLRKLNKAVGKRDEYGVKALQENEPVYTLDHILRERYPSFMDAIRDLDDCLCHVFLFATLPQNGRIPLKVIEASQKLASEFQNYIVLTNSLDKSFVSIKGIYYQATIRGVPVTWLVPHQFSVPIPADVDLRVMLTFLDFYHTMMGFINYKLYSDLQLKYPPQLDTNLDDNCGWLSAFVLQKKVESSDGSYMEDDNQPQRVSKKVEKKMRKRLNELMDGEKVAELAAAADGVLDDIKEGIVEATPDSIDEQNGNNSNQSSSDSPLFAGLTVFISREVPRTTLEFVLRSMGAVVCYPESSGHGSPYPETSSQITHQIVDRPLESLNCVAGRVYVQPQWAFDCLNKKEVLSCQLYAPGQQLPPHLSPFHEYDPTHGQQDEDADMVEDETTVDQLERINETEDKQKVTIVPTAKQPSVEAQRKKGEQERIQRAKMVMSNKKRKLYEAIERRNSKETDKQRILASKKRAL